MTASGPARVGKISANFVGRPHFSRSVTSTQNGDGIVAITGRDWPNGAFFLQNVVHIWNYFVKCNAQFVRPFLQQNAHFVSDFARKSARRIALQVTGRLTGAGRP